MRARIVHMSGLAERQRLLKNVLDLRAAERKCRGAAEINRVRWDLERSLGPTVMRALAARALGVSQTALERWIQRGDIPTVLTPRGRHDVPLGVVLELAEEVERRRKHGARFPLAAVLKERRARADDLDVGKLLPLEEGAPPDARHRGADLRSLIYHRAVAQRLDDRIVSAARDRVRRWRAEGRLHPDYADRWEELLSRPTAEIATVLIEDSPVARDLRQNSPFAGVLSEPERRRVLEAVGSRQ
jgi:hypothetical protein